MHFINTKGFGSNTYINAKDIVKAIRAELDCNEHMLDLIVNRIKMLASNLEGICFKNKCGNLESINVG